MGLFVCAQMCSPLRLQALGRRSGRRERVGELVSVQWQSWEGENHGLPGSFLPWKEIFLGSTFPVRLALSALSCCITAHPQGQPLSDQMALCLPGTS